MRGRATAHDASALSQALRLRPRRSVFRLTLSQWGALSAPWGVWVGQLGSVALSFDLPSGVSLLRSKKAQQTL